MTSTRRRTARTRELIAGVGGAASGARAALLVGLYAIAAPALASGESLTLERAIDTALARNETARAAEERVRAADARVAQARSGFLPDVTLGGSYTRSTGDLGGSAAGAQASRSGDDAVAGTATLSVPLFDPRNVPLYRRAKLDRAGARLEAGDAREVLAFSVAGSFFGALTAEQVLAAAERRLQLARATHADASDRAGAGLVGTNDVTRAEVELWSAERDLTRARSALEIARVQLAYLLDVAPPEDLAAPDALLAAAAQASGGEDALAAEALQRRKDVRALELRADALRAFADEARLRFLPSLSLTGQLRSFGDETFGGFRNDAVVGATLTWPLWDGGLRRAERRERLSLAAIGDLDRSAAARGTTRDLQEALASLRGGQAATRQAEAAALAARRNSEESTILYRQGLATALAVADANTRLFEAEVDVARTRFDLAQAFLALRRATGLDPLGRELP
ncbi:MAG TPA: TolC family protein [Anaeromyxobacteraceae bacterium]|nr:TolC family protein [Anaeromyxobacteraceae bacterium]